MGSRFDLSDSSEPEEAVQRLVPSAGGVDRAVPPRRSAAGGDGGALLSFLERTDKSLACYVKALAPAVQDLKNAYPHYMDPQTDDDTFLQMMILDGCFILELMRTTAKLKLKQAGATPPYAPNDPIFSNHDGLYLRPLLKRDMLMLENQIPLLLLIKLKEAEA